MLVLPVALFVKLFERRKAEEQLAAMVLVVVLVVECKMLEALRSLR
jgi:hypothetical protein